MEPYDQTPREYTVQEPRGRMLRGVHDPSGERLVVEAGPPGGEVSPPPGGGRQPLLVRLTGGGALGQYSFVEVEQDETSDYNWSTVTPGGVTGSADGFGIAWEPNGNANLPTDASDGAGKGLIVWLEPSPGNTGADYAIVAGSAGSIAVFGASGAPHSTGIVPDPGAVAGTTKFLREDATWAVPAGGGGSTFSGARLLGDSTLNYPTGTTTDARWTLGFDSGGYTTGVSPYTTLQLTAGSTYLVGAVLVWNESATNGWRHVEILDQAGLVFTEADVQLTATPSTISLSVSTLYRPTSTGGIKVRGQQSSGFTRTIAPISSFWVCKVG